MLGTHAQMCNAALCIPDASKMLSTGAAAGAAGADGLGVDEQVCELAVLMLADLARGECSVCAKHLAFPVHAQPCMQAHCALKYEVVRPLET